MNQKYIPALIMLVAGAVTSILDIINRTPKIDSLKRLLLVLILFYFIGLVAKAIIKRAVAMKATEDIEELSGTDERRQEENGQDKNRQEAAKNEKTGPPGNK